MSIGIELISKERNRQIEKEGWDKKHDAEHGQGELSLAAACYAGHAAGHQIYVMEDKYVNSITFEDPWPWDDRWDKRYVYGDRKEDLGNMVCDPKSLTDIERLDLLIKAGALIAAEIDKIKNEE
jgi:hypothetical protein